MVSLALAGLYFLAIHLFVSGSRLRDAIVARTGEQGFLGLFSLLSLIGIIWIVRAWGAAPLIPVWGPLLWFRPIALVLVFVAFLLVVIGLATPSPTATGGEGVLRNDEPATGILRVTRHPFLMGVTLWAGTHLIAAGDVAALLFFGTFALLGAIGPRLIDAKRGRKLGDRWEVFAGATSIVPFMAIAQRRNRFVASELGAWRIVSAVAAYAVFLSAHGWLFGVVPTSF